jgi:hypothetical protein
MCENDAAVDAWFAALNARASAIIADKSMSVDDATFRAISYKSGHLSGVIRELAATVPGVREWLIEHMPGEG